MSLELNPIGLMSPTVIARSPIERLQDHIRGRVILPGDGSYETDRRVWNAAIDRKPAAIVRPAGIGDIQIAVRFAVTQGLPLSVRSGGHGVSGAAIADRGLVIDLRSLKRLSIDPIRRIAYAETGLTWGEFNMEAQYDGLTVPSGKLSGIGLGGSALGGGVGWLVRQYGMTIDHILAAEIVTADGQRLNVNADEHPDLFWAIRGGGGNFGVVSSLTFSMVPVLSVFGGLVGFPFAFAPQVLRAFRDLTAEAPDNLTVSVVLFCGPDGSKLIGFAACFNGPADEGQRHLKPLIESAPAVMVSMQEMPYGGLLKAVDDSVVPGMGHRFRGGFIRGLNDDLIEQLVAGYADFPTPHATIVINHVGGAMGKVAPDATAFPHRSESLLLEVIGGWADEREALAASDWTIGLWESLRPHTTGAAFASMLDTEGPDRVRAAYGANYHRLATIKRWYDPNNIFHHNQNIAPR